MSRCFRCFPCSPTNSSRLEPVDLDEEQFWDRWEKNATRTTKIPRRWLEYKQKTSKNTLVVITQDSLEKKLLKLDQQLSGLESRDVEENCVPKEEKEIIKKKLELKKKIDDVLDETYYIGPPRFVKGFVYEADLGEETDRIPMVFK